MEQRQLRIETCVYCFRYIGFIVEVSKNHVMRTILQKNITIEVGLIEQAAQVDIQDLRGCRWNSTCSVAQVGKIAQSILFLAM